MERDIGTYPNFGSGPIAAGNIGDLQLLSSRANRKRTHTRNQAFRQESSWKSWWHLFSTGVFLGGLYFGIFWPSTPLWLRITFSVLAGLTIARMFIIYHDHQHKAILQNSKFADAVMTLWGLFILAPTSIWQRSHDHHHKHNSKLYRAASGPIPS